MYQYYRGCQELHEVLGRTGQAVPRNLPFKLGINHDIPLSYNGLARSPIGLSVPLPDPIH